MRLTPATILHADFNSEGQLVIGTLTQVAVFTTDGELSYLLDLPRAQRSWSPVWLSPNLIAIKDDQQIVLWQPTAGRSLGPWQPRKESISHLFNVAGHLLVSYADRTELLSTSVLQQQTGMSVPDFVQLTFIQLTQASSLLQQAISPADGMMYRAYAGGELTATKIATYQQIWRTQLTHGNYVRAITAKPDSVFVIMQDNADPFARGRGQRVIQVNLKSGKVTQELPLPIESQAVSLLIDTPYIYVGGSENCVFALHESGASVPLCYPQVRRWGDNSGQVIALYQNADNLVAVTSSGYLQIWRKQDIVSLLTDK